MPRPTLHTAELTEIEGKPFLAIKRAKIGGDGQVRKTNGGIWIDLQPAADRTAVEILADLRNARAACIAFVDLVDNIVGVTNQPAITVLDAVPATPELPAPTSAKTNGKANGKPRG